MTTDGHSVAVTGLSCRFPGDGDSLENFWESICSGTSAWSKIPRDRFNVDAFWSPSKNRNTSITQGAHFLKQDVSTFDANFFSLPKSDVEAMDPQQRIMVEVAYEALEKAGLPLEKIAGTQTGVFMGHFTSDYKEMIYRDPDNAPAYSITGACKTSLANRISWLWDLRGPSFTMDTACSSSLVALHLACQSLRTGDSDIAIVGGTSLLLNPEMFLYLSNQAFLSPDGKCKSFDDSANGYGRGEGFGCVVLKRVDDAITTGDPIRAVIRGTGSNQDGHTKGFTLPSSDAQAALIRATYRKAGLDPKGTGYVEAHGTGTQAGDSEETHALASTIAASRAKDDKLVVGSVKSNIGHLEAAAGIAGIIKAILILENGLIPPSINFNKPNSKIKFDEWNIKIPTALTPWPKHGVRRISTNSFGYGGTNAHAILDDAPSYLKERGVLGHHYTTSFSQGHAANGMRGMTNGVKALTNDINGHQERSRPRLLVLSAQDKDGLERVRTPLTQYVQATAKVLEGDGKGEETFMAELAYTLSERRSRLAWKTYRLASSATETVTVLNDEESPALVAQSSRAPRIGFVFTGQGAQWPRMGVELMAYPAFKDSVEAADTYLRAECDCPWSAVEELRKGKSSSKLHLAEYSQALCTVLQVALVDLLRTWNIRPVATAGHSSGEMAASYAMGAISKTDAWKIAYYRGVLSTEMKQNAPDIDGSMMAAGLSREQAEDWIAKVTEGEVVVACINSPSSVTLSGDTTGIDQLLGMLKEASIFARKLQVDTAYHSPHMQTVAQEYYELLADVTTQETTGECKMHSSVTGVGIEASQLGAVNWVKNLTSPVQFSSAIHDMLRPLQGKKRAETNAVDLLVEIGPHSALQGPATQSLKAKGITNISYRSAVTRNENAIETAMNLAGALFAQGAPVDIRQVNQDGNIHSTKPLVDLPSYPWKHSQRYWHESRVEREYLSRATPKLSLLGAPSPSFGEGERLWRGFIRLSEEPWIADHKIQGSILYPAAGFIAMALEAAHQTVNETQHVAAYKLRDIQLRNAAIINEGADLEMVVQFRPHSSGTRDSSSTWTEFIVTSSPDGKNLVTNCSGLLVIDYEPVEGSEIRRQRDFELQTLRSQYLDAKTDCENALNPAQFYNDLTVAGLDYGPAFANLSSIQNRSGQSICTVEIPDIKARTLEGSDRPHIIHPGTLDAVFHLAFAAIKGDESRTLSAAVPKFIGEVVISAQVPFEPGTKVPGFANSAAHGSNELTADIVMLDEFEYLPVIEVTGMVCAKVGGASASNVSESNAKSITSRLTWKPAIDLIPFSEHRMTLDKEEGIDKLAEYLKLLHHSNPSLSVLEVVPRSGAPLLPKLKSFEDVFKTGDVTFACQDEASMESLEQDRALPLDTHIEILDVSQEFSAEMIKDRSYDVMVAFDLGANVSKLNVAVITMIKLLKKEGKICILEPNSTLEEVQLLLDTNHAESMVFQNIDEDASQQLSLVMAKINDMSDANGVNGVTKKEVVLIQPAEPAVHTQAVASDLTACLEKTDHSITPFRWGSDISKLSGKSCISLMELETPLLRDLGRDDFDTLKNAVLGAQKMFWIVGFDDPSAALIDGVARVVRNEVPGLSFRTLHTKEQTVLSTGNLTELIVRAFNSKTEDDEYLINDGVLQVSRIEEDEVLNAQINDVLPGAESKIVSMPLKQAQYPLKLAVQKPGMLDSLCLEPDDLPETALEETFIEIQVKATALNFREVMVAMGQIPDSKLGLDAAGVVHRVGSAVTKFKVGDRVAMYGHGSHRTFHRSHADYCALIPEEMTFEEAATIPTVHGTAWNALVRLAKVRKGQSVLIHAAAGGVGQAAIQIAKHFEMEIFATVSSDTKRKLIRDEHDVPDDHIFNSRDLSFVKGVKRMTKNRGVDVVLNSLSGEALRQTWHCIAPFGYFIEIGLRDILANTELDMRPFIQDATFSFFNLTHIESDRPDIMGAIIEGAFEFIHRGITKPVTPLVTYPMSELENAFRLMQAGKHVGKIALTWDDDHIVPVLQKDMSAPSLDPEGVYMLAGGLGGLGRSLSSKLAQLGARKLCFLSRSGMESKQAEQMIQSLEEQDVEARVYKCDIAEEKDVSAVVTKCKSELGEIRGVFQCAMILRDVLFEKMSYQEWIESTRPKVQGSWNLHQHLSSVDFFVTLSSFAAIFGNRGQSNYAAGGAFEDALAYHRRTLALPGTTLDLGIMRDIGVLAETGITESLREWEKPYGIREPEFLALIERAIAGELAKTSSPQVLTGLATGGSVIANGIDVPYYLDNARFAIMAQTGIRAQGSGATGDSIPTQTLVSRATSLEEAGGYVVEALIKVVAKMLQTSVSEIDTSRFLHSYGIDSLVAIEIINWALKEVKATVTVFDVLAAMPMTTFANKIAAKSETLPKELVPM